MSDEEIEQKELEAEAEVLPERQLMSLIAPDAAAGGLPAPPLEGVDSDADAEDNPSDETD
jgi:hypothetical protein